MFVVIRFVMPIAPSGGEELYTLDKGSSWLIRGAEDGKWIKVYRYNETLQLEISTALGSKVTMKNIGKNEYADLDNINITMTCYAMGTNEEELDTAWTDIKAHYGQGNSIYFL